MRTTRTDLAMESFENASGSAIPGVEVCHWEENDVSFTQVKITQIEAARMLGKPKGSYLTLESPLLRQREPEARLSIASMLAEELDRLLPDGDASRPVMVVGLGNRAITPDSLGPAVVDRTLVTRHVLQSPVLKDSLHSVCAIAPGVLGVTGIESLDLVEALVKSLSPRAIVCVDSLSARSALRIGSAIQLTDTGIQPGAGVGNHRKALTEQSVGVPVISVGVPTVIYAATLARDAFEWLSLQSGDLDDHDAALADMERTLLAGDLGEMIVTPREIDAIVQDAAGIIASGINRALQPNLSDAEIAAMMD